MSSNINLLPATLDDIPTLAAVSHTAFEKDAHTRLKTLAAGYNHGDIMCQALPSWIRDDGKGIVIKVVTNEGETIGWAAWSFVGFKYEGEAAPSQETSISPTQVEGGKNHEITQTLPPPPQIPLDATKSKIQQLGALSGGAMQHYSALLTPPGTKCLILIAINILPSHQSQGVGSSLLRWGTSIADKQKVYTWVSSSHDGYQVFEKAGFRDVGRLNLCLDAFAFDAEGNRVENGEGDRKGKWGEYIWRYLRREVGGS